MAIENPLLMVFPLKSTSSSKVFGESLPNNTVFSCLQRFGALESLAAERQVPACVHTPSQRERVGEAMARYGWETPELNGS